MQMLNVIPKSPTKPKIPHKTQKIPQTQTKPQKNLQKDKSPPPSLHFQCFETLFLFYFGRGLEKNLQIFSAKDIFCATISFVFKFAWQMNGKFGTEFAIRLLRQAKSESARRKSQLKSALTRATKARLACHFVLSY